MKHLKNIKAPLLLIAGGLAFYPFLRSLEDKAVAGVPGESAGSIAAALTTWLKVYNETVEQAQKLQKTANESLSKIEEISKIETKINEQKEKATEFLDSFHELKNDPLGARIPKLDERTFPLLTFTKDSIDYYDKLFEKAEKENMPNRKTNLSHKMRLDAGLSMGKAAAFEARQRAKKLKDAVGKSSKIRSETRAETYAKQRAPIADEIALLTLESELRQEELLNLLVTNTVLNQKIKSKDYTSDDYKKSLGSFKEGNGTLADLTNGK